MVNQEMSRRTLLKGGGAAVAGLSALQVAGPAHAFPGGPGEEVIPWLDQPPRASRSPTLQFLKWEELDSFLTPADEFFVVSHYGNPVVDAAAWRLGIGGLVARPQSLSLADLKARPRREVTFTLECSGNTRLPVLHRRDRQRPLGGHAAGAAAGAGRGPRRRAPRSCSGAPIPGRSRSATTAAWSGSHPGRAGRARVPTDIDLTITEQFARSMSLEEALSGDNLLCYEMNGVPLPREHGFPVRLIAPGWYGVANVKWLTRIEVMDQRFAGRFMARDYVTIREQVRDGQTVWTFNTVRHDRLKSAPAKVTRRRGRYSIMGAAWGAPIAEVEVQIDDGPWMTADARRPTSPEGRLAGPQRLRVEVLDVRLGQARRRRAHDPLARVSTSTATSSRRPTTPTSRARSRSGRATGRSPAAWRFRPVVDGPGRRRTAKRCA